MRVLALDIGEKRVGVAYGDTDSGVALPLSVLPAVEVEAHAAPFRRLLEDYEPELLVVGRPLTMAGEPGPQAQRVQDIAQRCRRQAAFLLNTPTNASPHPRPSASCTSRG